MWRMYIVWDMNRSVVIFAHIMNVLNEFLPLLCLLIPGVLGGSDVFLVQENWDTYAVSPYKNWDNEKLQAYLKAKGIETKEAAEANKDSLISTVQSSWYETEDKAQTAWSDVKDWILDTWTESQLKAFCDHHAIPGESAPNSPGGTRKCTVN